MPGLPHFCGLSLRLAGRARRDGAPEVAALTGEEVLVDRLAHQRVPEGVGVAAALDKDVVGDRLPEGLGQLGLVHGRHGGEQAMRDAPPRSGDHAQELLGGRGEGLHADHERVSERLRKRLPVAAVRRRR